MRRGAAALVLVMSAVVPSGRAQTSSIVLTGHVIASDTGDPLRNARVVVGAVRDLPALLTDIDGRFSITVGADACCAITVTKPGYAKTTVKAPAQREPLTVRLSRGSAISGSVIDENGDPVIRASVIVETLPEDGKRGAVIAAPRTDDLGEYRAGSLPAGQVIVSMFASPAAIRMLPDGGIMTSGRGDPQSRVYFPGVSNVAQAATFSLRPGDEKTGINFTVTAAAIRSGQAEVRRDEREVPSRTSMVIGGHIFRPGGRPVIAAIVRLMPSGSTMAPPKLAFTDGDGAYRFVLPGQAAGTYRVAATSDGYVSVEYGQQRTLDAGEEISVAPGEERARIDITLARPGAFAGRLFDEYGDPVEGVAVRASQVRWVDGRRRLVELAPFTRPTDDLGRFRIFGLEPGEYVVSAGVGQILTGQPSADLPGYGTTYYPGTPNPAEAQRVVVGRSQDVSGIDFPIARVKTSRVAGRAVDSTGEPITGGIALVPSRRSGAVVATQLGAKIERDGQFEFPNVTPGEYVLQSSRHRSSGWNEGESSSQFVTVNGVDVADLVVRTTVGSTLSGRVVLSGGGTIAPGQIELLAMPADTDLSPLIGGGPARATPDEDLKFQMAGLSGPRRLRVTRVPPGWGLQAILANGSDVTDTPLPFGKPGQSLTDVEVVLSQRVTIVSGRATTRGRGIAASILVFAADRQLWYPQSRFFKRTTSAADGTFTIEGLAAGEFLAAAVDTLPGVRNGDDWQDPEYLDTLVVRARPLTLSDGGRASLTLDVLPR